LLPEVEVLLFVVGLVILVVVFELLEVLLLFEMVLLLKVELVLLEVTFVLGLVCEPFLVLGLPVLFNELLVLLEFTD
jgi:hypothetical protein